MTSGLTQLRVDTQQLSRLATALIREGREYYGSLSWHGESDPFRLLVAEYLLRRTTRRAVNRVYPELIRSFPTARRVAEASGNDLWRIARPVGLRNRVLTLKKVAQSVEDQRGVPFTRELLRALPHVGPYVADSVLLYTGQGRALPLDANIQRVVNRAALGTNPNKPEDPYADVPLRNIVSWWARRRRIETIKLLHQGVLSVAWTWCRGTPIHEGCPLSRHCRYYRRVRRAL